MQAHKTRKYTVVGFKRLRFSVEVEATSKTEARRKFEEYTKDGTSGWDSVGTSVRVMEIKRGGGRRVKLTAEQVATILHEASMYLTQGNYDFTVQAGDVVLKCTEEGGMR